MSFLNNKFMGLSIRDIRCSLGFGNQISQINLQLVYDAVMGDLPSPVPYGWPAYLDFYGLKFWGLLQKFEECHAVDGLPTYEAVLVDPRQILEGTQLVVGDYSGSTNGIYNLINCFGYFESSNFGSSGANQAGMPWARVVTALNTIVNSPTYSAYGGPLNYRGVTYGLDLSEMPMPPAYYRVNGPNLTLMDAITQICEDAACDFWVQLIGRIIKIKVINRNAQPPLGAISDFISKTSLAGGVCRGAFGVESRNDVTSAFIVGGPKTTLHITDAIYSFWGYDISGQPIIGTPYNHPDAGLCEKMTLNATGVADIVGDVSYISNTMEMRCALYGIESWTTYIRKYKKKTIAPLICGIHGGNLDSPIIAIDAIDDSSLAVKNAVSEEFQTRTSRLYSWLRNIAESYYGKQFLVQIPFVLTKTDAETQQITYSQEPCEAGYLPDGAAAIGLSPLNQDIIQQADERVLPFAHFPTISGADTTRIDWSSTAIELDQVYTRSNISQIVYLPGTVPVPCVVMQLGSVLYDKELDLHGNVDEQIIQPVLQPSEGAGALSTMTNRAAFGTVGVIGIHPAARYPDIVGIPLRSNAEVYGPWYVAGSPGKVRFESDQSLTPWDYGGYAFMNIAGQAKAATAVTTLQVQETGEIMVPGAPLYSLGDIVVSGGPNLTNMDITYGTSGVTTNYRFQTFTPRFGLFSHQNSERMRRIALGAIETRRNLRKALNRAFAAAQTLSAAFKGKLANRALYANKRSPHIVLMAESFSDDLGDTRVGIGTESYESALYLSRPTSSGATNRAVMSLTGLMRPYTTKVSNNSTLLPGCTSPDTTTTSGSNNALTHDKLNPFGEAVHDISVVTSRSTYAGMNAWQQGSDTASTRAIALRGPLVVAGWGYGIDGNAYPDGTSVDLMNNTRRRSDKWKVGEVDLLWDNKRGVWTSHDNFIGTLASDITAGGTALLNIGGSTSWQLTVKNPWSQSIAAGTKVVVTYIINENNWQVTAADCV